MADVNLPSYQKVGRVTIRPEYIVSIKDECYPYPSSAKLFLSERSTSAIRYQPTQYGLGQMSEQEHLR